MTESSLDDVVSTSLINAGKKWFIDTWFIDASMDALGNICDVCLPEITGCFRSYNVIHPRSGK